MKRKEQGKLKGKTKEKYYGTWGTNDAIHL